MLHIAALLRRGDECGRVGRRRAARRGVARARAAHAAAAGQARRAAAAQDRRGEGLAHAPRQDRT